MSQAPPPNTAGAPSMFCPHCNSELRNKAQYAGEVVTCPDCGGKFQAPVPQAVTATPAPSAPSPTRTVPLNTGIPVCMLIAGIGNVLSGLVFVSFYIFAIIGIPQIVLGVIQLVYFSQAEKKPLHEALSHAMVLGILAIVSGLFNLISLVCGILIVVFASNHES